MDAEEIREHVARLSEWAKQDNSTLDYKAAQVGALWEIAAQLAELNHLLHNSTAQGTFAVTLLNAE